MASQLPVLDKDAGFNTHTSSMNMSNAALKPCQTISLGPVSRIDRSLKQKVRAALWGISMPNPQNVRSVLLSVGV
jgi:hypothetical protein